MTAIGLLCALVFWLFAALTLSEFEGNVRVLHPATRIAYGCAAFLAGIVLAVRIAMLHP